MPHEENAMLKSSASLPDLMDDCLMEGASLHLLLDGCSKANILKMVYSLDSQPQLYLLYSGTEFSGLIHISPCLIRVKKGSSLFRWFTEEGAKEGIIILARVPFKEVAICLQSRLEAMLPNKDAVLFRYYDPVVLHTYLESLDSQELARFLEPLDMICYQAPPSHEEEREFDARWRSVSLRQPA